MIAFYNEWDDYCCAWLSNLMDAGHITPGIISNKSIEDLIPYELIGYDRVHLFAGIGVWDYALNLAGWGNRPVWTASCPCQPFSSAGKGVGFDDERHLWPAACYLIEQCKPPKVLGEQVASGAASAWIDLVHVDLESLGYAFGCVPFPSAGVGAPHIRDRAYWVANSELSERGVRDQRGTVIDGQAGGRHESADHVRERGDTFGLGNPEHQGLAQRKRDAGISRVALGRNEGQAIERAGVHIGGVADAHGTGFGTRSEGVPAVGYGSTIGADSGVSQVDNSGRGAIELARPGPTNGAWGNADWLRCRDGKWRPVEPGTFPLVNGATRRVGRLRAYGNAINAEAAKAFIQSYMSIAE